MIIYPRRGTRARLLRGAVVLLGLEVARVTAPEPAPRSTRGRKARWCYPRAPGDWWRTTPALKLVQLPGPALGALASSARLPHPLSPAPSPGRAELGDRQSSRTPVLLSPSPFSLVVWEEETAREKREERGAWPCVGVGCYGELGAARRRAVAAAAAARSRRGSQHSNRQAAL